MTLNCTKMKKKYIIPVAESAELYVEGALLDGSPNGNIKDDYADQGGILTQKKKKTESNSIWNNNRGSHPIWGER